MLELSETMSMQQAGQRFVCMHHFIEWVGTWICSPATRTCADLHADSELQTHSSPSARQGVSLMF